MPSDRFVDFIETLTAVAYGLALLAQLFFFFFRPGDKKWAAWSFGIFGFAAGLHTLFLLSTTIQLGYFPFHYWIASISFIAWAIAVGFAYLRLTNADRRMGVFIAPVVFVFQLISMIAAQEEVKELSKNLQSSWFGIHVGVSLFACSAFSLSGCFSLSYLLLSQEIRLKRLRFFFRRMPPLADLERMNHRIILLGFTLLTVAIASGIAWAIQLPGRSLTSDYKQILICVLWLCYAALIHFRYRQGWQGSRTALFSLLNFIAVLVVIIIIGLLGTSFHGN